MNWNKTNVILVRIAWVGILVVIAYTVAGCAMVIPYNECSDTMCEEKAIKREDMQFKRNQLELERLACTVPYIWNTGSRRCVLSSLLI